MPWITERYLEKRGSEVRTVTVTLGTGYFEFEWLKILDEDGVERNVFGEGEIVYFDCRVANFGVATDMATFTLTDEDTGESIISAGMTIPPSSGLTFGKTKVGSMPDHDWHLKFEVTP